MRVTVLGSGSAGNSTLVEAGSTRILIDAGFSGRELERRLTAVGVDAESIDGIVITHEHSDHTHGMGVLARRYGLPLYLTPITHASCSGLLNGSEPVHEYSPARPFQIGPLEFHPFLTIHDAVDPVAIAVQHVESGHKLGVATDLGRPTAAVRHALTGCDVLVLEANHDETMLWDGPYPWTVKQRIASSHGHLSNRAAAELATELHHPDLSAVILAHLSEECNDRTLARAVVGEALEGCGYTGRLIVARQEEPIEPIEISELKLEQAGDQLTLL